MFLSVTREEQRRVGERIKRARREAGYKQAQLARELGLADARTIRNYESGVRIPAYEIMDGIARVTGKPREWFFHDEHNAPIDDQVAELRQEVAEMRAEIRALIELNQRKREGDAGDQIG